ncbi:hypothetical protein NLG97_g3761 [Lecanicillium saksenae]|uniref:Uncharacterized protein n=1 Tax=Lecanicillium saksenae TaxID=468837 RepID=A0ACC1R0F2_9HYPO|nr:hypothetical protein NLG97_g3761 [Lecanicillium saksenae]
MEGPTSDMFIDFDHGKVERMKLKRTYPSFLDGQDFIENNNTGGPRHVPGVHLAINFERLPVIQFSHGFGEWKQERLNSMEIAMIQLMNDITEEENWYTRVREFDSVQRWKRTAISQFNLDSDTWDWCLFELIGKAEKYSQREASILALDAASRVYKTDRFGDTDLFKELTKNTLGRSISPWLYPFIYAGSPIRADGRSVRLDNITDCIGGGSVPPKPFWDNDCSSGEEKYYSDTSQWLPADMKFTDNSIRFNSSINNLHPIQHKPLYAAIETLISESLPDWNQVLLYKSLQRNGPRIQPQNLRCHSCVDTEDSCTCTVQLGNFAEWSRGNISPGVVAPPENENWSAIEAINGVYTDSRKLYNEISLRQAFAKRGLQVYVELASIDIGANGVMSQESSQRLQWNLNGNRNERIVATTLICLRRENIREDSGQISFRTELKRHEMGENNTLGGRTSAQVGSQASYISAVPAPPLFQKLVTINLPAGRTITYSNALQHKIERLQLVDESKSGSLQFLAVHLADPHYMLCSTRHVPPQSVAWWWEAAKLGFVFKKFNIPTEIRGLISDYAIGKGYGHSIEDDESEDDNSENGDDENEDDGNEDDGNEDDGNEDDGNEDDGNEDNENEGDDNEGNDNEEDGSEEGGDEHGGNDDSEGDNEGDDGTGKPGLSEGSRFTRDTSPEKPQEEKPIRIEAAVRMREKALKIHGEVMDAVNGLRIYGVPGHHRAWFRKMSDNSVPLDHTDPEDAQYPVVNAVIKDDGTIVRAPDQAEDDEYDNDEESDDDWNSTGRIDDEQNSSATNIGQDSQANDEAMLLQEVASQDSGQAQTTDEQNTEEQIAEQLHGERVSSEMSELESDGEDATASEGSGASSATSGPLEVGSTESAESCRGTRRRGEEDLGDFSRIRRQRL